VRLPLTPIPPGHADDVGRASEMGPTVSARGYLLPIAKTLLIMLAPHRINGPRKERGPWQEGDGKKELFI
jgi:hypothetical protein